jgi:hypothetical protein
MAEQISMNVFLSSGIADQYSAPELSEWLPSYPKG